jgi:hypothetical protein
MFQYDQYKTPMENIGLQDSLLSRFDLLFIVLDKVCFTFIVQGYIQAILEWRGTMSFSPKSPMHFLKIK